MSHSNAGVVAVAATSVAACMVVALGAFVLRPVSTIEVEGGLRLVLEIDPGAPRQDVAAGELIGASIPVMQRRLREMDVANGKVRPEGEDRVVIDLAGASDHERARKLADVVARAGRLEFRMVDKASPDEAWRARIRRADDLLYETVAGEKLPMLVKKEVVADANDLIDAQVSLDYRTGDPIVNFKFSNTGGLKFARATQENVGQRFAIVLDGEVISAPVIREPILGGSGQISGVSTMESANDLAILLRVGALPVTYKLVEIREVPPATR